MPSSNAKRFAKQLKIGKISQIGSSQISPFQISQMQLSRNRSGTAQPNSFQCITLPRLLRLSLVLLLIPLTLGSLSGCRQGTDATDRISEDSAAAQEIERDLTFNNITLEETDETGMTLWQIDADQVIYSQDRQAALVRNPEGDIYQDGEPVLHIRAEQGQIRRDGDRIFLENQVEITDLRSGAQLRGDRMEWSPDEDLLIIRNNLIGVHPRVRITGNEARLYNRERRLEVEGEPVVAISRDPAARLQSEAMTWFLDEERLVSDRPVLVERLGANDQITDTAAGEQGEMNLNQQVATLRRNARITLSDPPLQVFSDELIWNLEASTIVSNQPVRVVQVAQQTTLMAERGRFNLEERMVYLRGNVRAIAQRNEARLNSDTLDWNLDTEEFQAEGNVDYVQQADPPMRVQGPQADGELTNQTIVVGGGRVTTEIVPE
jgi:LPS export ABC transporter protein LptC